MGSVSAQGPALGMPCSATPSSESRPASSSSLRSSSASIPTCCSCPRVCPDESNRPVCRTRALPGLILLNNVSTARWVMEILENARDEVELYASSSRDRPRTVTNFGPPSYAAGCCDLGRARSRAPVDPEKAQRRFFFLRALWCWRLLGAALPVETG